MFMQSARFTAAHGGRAREISIHGPEMGRHQMADRDDGLAINELTGNIKGATRSLTNDQHKGLKAQFVMANRLFNQKRWGCTGRGRRPLAVRRPAGPDAGPCWSPQGPAR